MDRFGVASVAVRRLACGLLAGAALLAVPVILAGWPVRQALAAEPAGSQPEIRFAEGTDTPTSMPGNQSRNTSTDDILGHVVESLVALKNEMSIGPMLADSWTISPDGTTYTFRLRDGVLFHNGAPVTSAEVKWSFDYLMNPHSGFECRSVFSGQRGVKVLAVRTPDPRTVVFELDHPYALFLTQMANPRCPLAVLHPSSVDAQGHWLKPVATGPYVFSEWRKGQYVRLTPFAQYKPRPEPPDGMAGAKTAYAPLRFVTIPDAAAQKSALLSGQIDAMAIDEDGPEHQLAAPDVGSPDDAKSQDNAMVPFEYREVGGVDLAERAAGPPTFEYWCRVGDRTLGDDQAIHQALLSHVTDLGVIGTALRPIEGLSQADSTVKIHTAVTSHQMWFHRPFRFDDWCLVAQESPVVTGGRGFGWGHAFDSDKRLVASFAQESMIRPLS